MLYHQSCDCPCSYRQGNRLRKERQLAQGHRPNNWGEIHAPIWWCDLVKACCPPLLPGACHRAEDPHRHTALSRRNKARQKNTRRGGAGIWTPPPRSQSATILGILSLKNCGEIHIMYSTLTCTKLCYMHKALQCSVFPCDTTITTIHVQSFVTSQIKH